MLISLYQTCMLNAQIKQIPKVSPPKSTGDNTGSFLNIIAFNLGSYSLISLKVANTGFEQTKQKGIYQ